MKIELIKSNFFMKGRDSNKCSLKNLKYSNNHSLKINNKFKKSSTNQYNKKAKNISLYTANNINNNIYLNLFNKFSNNTSSLHKKSFGQKQLISNRMNNSHLSKEKKKLNIIEVPSSSSIKRKKSYYYDHSSLINTMNIIDNHGNINIRLNLKNQFINNTNKNYNNLTDANYGFDIAGKLKEKDLKIIELQNDLLKSQEIIKNLKKKSNNNSDVNKYNYLNNSSQDKNKLQLTRSTESVDKIINTAFNVYSSNIIINNNNMTKKKINKKNCKNSFLKRCGNKNIIENIKNLYKKEKNGRKQSARNDNNNNIYSEYNKKKQSDYLRLFLPLSNCNNGKPKFNSYSSCKKNSNNKSNIENINKTGKNNNYIHYFGDGDVKKKEEFLTFKKKCEELKEKTKNLFEKYMNLGDFVYKSKFKST